MSRRTDIFILKPEGAVEDNIFALGHPDLNADADAESDTHPELATALANARTFDPRKFQLITLYEQRLHRSMQKSLALLRQLQAERKAAREIALEEVKLLAMVNYLKKLPYDPATDFPPGNGFVFSSAEINSAIARGRRVEESRYYKTCRWRTNDPYRPVPVNLIELAQAA